MTSTALASIPVIDVSGSASELEVGKALVNAAETHGFVFIRNQGKDITIENIDKQFELARSFLSPDVEAS